MFKLLALSTTAALAVAAFSGFGLALASGGDIEGAELRLDADGEVKVEDALVTWVDMNHMTFKIDVQGQMIKVDATMADLDDDDFTGVMVGDFVDVEGTFSMSHPHPIIAEEVDVDQDEDLDLDLEDLDDDGDLDLDVRVEFDED